MAPTSSPGTITLGDDHIKINTIPTKGFVKFRKDLMGLVRIGANWEFHNDSIESADKRKLKQSAKVVFKPLMTSKRTWKFIYEPGQHEISLLFKQQIPVTKFLNIQVGFGANIQDRKILWKGKFSSPKDLHSGADNVSVIRDKRSFALFPGLDLGLWWSAKYALPEISGLLNISRPDFKPKINLEATFDRVEAIFMIDTLQETRKQRKEETVKQAAK